MALPHAITGLTPREAVADAIYRACRGIDTNDKDLFDSAFTKDAVFDIEGRDPANGLAAMHTMFETVFKLDTTHFLSNVRVNIADFGAEGTLTCSALAYHLRSGTGPDAASPSYNSGCLYTVDTVKDEKEGLWRITKWHIKIIWLEGDVSVMMG